MDSIEEIKARVRREMKRQRLKQVDVERHGGMEPKSLSDFLNRGSKRPSHLLFAGIARGLDKTVPWLTGETERRDDETSESALTDRHLPRSIEAELSATDPYMARIVEDLIELLVTKGTVTEAELPPEAQELIRRRQSLRRSDSEDALE